MDTRKITVTSCKPATRRDGTKVTGHGANGPWTLYRVEGTDETGLPIQEEMSSFDELPLGEVTVTVTRRHSDYGDSLTLRPVGPVAKRLPIPADDPLEMVRESVRRLADRVSALEAVNQGVAFTTTREQTDAPVTVPARDDDIPF